MYRCSDCGKEFDVPVTETDDGGHRVGVCPGCGRDDIMEVYDDNDYILFEADPGSFEEEV